MLFHLVRVQHLADLECNLGRATQRISLALDRGLDAGKVFLRRRQQVFALARAFGGEVGIAADDQPFAREIGRGWPKVPPAQPVEWPDEGT
jgi:hypothetical protein